MKIVVTVSDQVWGGKHQYMHDIVNGLGRRGHSVTVVCEHGGRMHERYAISGQQHTVTASFIDHPIEAVHDLAELLGGKERPDVVITTGRHDSKVVKSVLSEENNRPGFIMFRHSAFPLEEGRATNELLMIVDYVICTSMEQADRQFSPYVAGGHLRADQIQTMASSVPPALLEQLSENDRVEERKFLGIDAETFLILVPARLSWEKGIGRVISAFAALSRDVRELAFVAVVGEGPAERSLRQQCDAENLSDSVAFFGHQDNMSRFYAASDVVVLTTLVPETGPLVLKEGMAAGLPVIASRTGGIEEFVADSVHGYLVDDDEQLVSCLERMIRDESLASRFGAQAHTDAICKHMLDPRLDYLELLLAGLHLKGGARCETLQSYEWSHVRLKETSTGGLIFVPITSLMIQLEAQVYAVVRDAVEKNDVSLLDNGCVDGETLQNLLDMGALVTRRNAAAK